MNLDKVTKIVKIRKAKDTPYAEIIMEDGRMLVAKRCTIFLDAHEMPTANIEVPLWSSEIEVDLPPGYVTLEQLEKERPRTRYLKKTNSSQTFTGE